MISLLTGKIASILAKTVTIDVAGVGYEVNCTRPCCERLSIGSPATIIIQTEVREDAIKLYGFTDQLEKQVFLLLMKVKGVGARTASEIVSQIDKRELLRVIGSGDLTRLQTVRGVGKKTGERILLELRDKVGEYVIDNNGPRESNPEVPIAPFEEALEALEALGFTKRDADRALEQVRKSGQNFPESSGAIVKEALRFV